MDIINIFNYSSAITIVVTALLPAVQKQIYSHTFTIHYLANSLILSIKYFSDYKNIVKTWCYAFWLLIKIQ